MEKDSTIKDRLLEFIEYMNLSRREFSKLIGKNPGYFNAITGEIGNETVKCIYLTFPQINLLWLITGEGEMCSSASENVTDREFINYLKNKISELEVENKQLIRENEVYKQQSNNSSDNCQAS